MGRDKSTPIPGTHTAQPCRSLGPPKSPLRHRGVGGVEDAVAESRPRQWHTGGLGWLWWLPGTVEYGGVDQEVETRNGKKPLKSYVGCGDGAGDEKWEKTLKASYGSWGLIRLQSSWSHPEIPAKSQGEFQGLTPVLMELGDRDLGDSETWPTNRGEGNWEGSSCLERLGPAALSVLAGLVPPGHLGGQCSWVLLGWPHCQARCPLSHITTLSGGCARQSLSSEAVPYGPCPL